MVNTRRTSSSRGECRGPVRRAAADPSRAPRHGTRPDCLQPARCGIRLPCVSLAVWPEPDAAPCRVEDKLRIDAGPGFGNAERGPLVNEPRRGGGHVHHREPNKCGPPPPANGYRTGPSGSESWSGLPRRGPWRPCRRRRTAGRTGWGAGLRPGHAARRAGVPRGGRRWTGYLGASPSVSRVLRSGHSRYWRKVWNHRRPLLSVCWNSWLSWRRWSGPAASRNRPHVPCAGASGASTAVPRR